jgi:chemotaxis methyl-accepting protein methylase
MTEFIRKIVKGEAQNILHHENETDLIALRNEMNWYSAWTQDSLARK